MNRLRTSESLSFPVAGLPSFDFSRPACYIPWQIIIYAMEYSMLRFMISFLLAATVMCAFPARLSAQAKKDAAPTHTKKTTQCHKTLSGYYAVVRNAAWKEVPLCLECADLPRCCYCQLPSSVKTEGEDRLCRTCAKDCIKDKAEAEKVMKDVRQVLSSKFKMTSKHKIIYEIGNRKALNMEADGEHNELGWFDPKTIRDKPQYTIRILTGLPRDVFRSVGAHELAHDWMDEALPHLMDKPEIREGFAEFVAWSFSKAEGNKRMMEYTEGRTDEVYGGGFRKVRAMMGNAKTAEEWKKILLKEFPLKRTKSGK